MKFATPIIQGVVIMLVMAVLSAGIKVYGQMETVEVRLTGIEKNLELLSQKIVTQKTCPTHPRIADR